VLETPTKRRLTRDQRLRIQTLREVGWTYEAIMKQYGVTKNAVRYACHNPPTPKKSTGRPAAVTEEEIQNIIAFICRNRENRRLPYARVIETLRLSHLTKRSLSYALQKHGFTRRVAAKKPPISEVNRQKRLAWAD
jgi:transposase